MSDRIQDTLGTLPTIPQIPAYNMRGQDSGPACGDGEAPGVNGSGQAAILGQTHWAAVGKLTPCLLHEINNGLCVIANHVQLLMLQSERRDWDILRPLQVMSDNLDHVETLTHRFAAYARLAQRPPCRLCLNALVDNAIALLEHQRAFRGLQIQKEFAQDLPEIEGIPGPLTDAVVELLSAGAQAIPRGGTLTISTQSSPQWVMIGFTGDGQWPQASDGSVTLARHIIVQLGGRLLQVWDPRPNTGDSLRKDQGQVARLSSGMRMALPRGRISS